MCAASRREKAFIDFLVLRALQTRPATDGSLAASFTD